MQNVCLFHVPGTKEKNIWENDNFYLSVFGVWEYLHMWIQFCKIFIINLSLFFTEINIFLFCFCFCLWWFELYKFFFIRFDSIQSKMNFCFFFLENFHNINALSVCIFSYVNHNRCYSNEENGESFVRFPSTSSSLLLFFFIEKERYLFSQFFFIQVSMEIHNDYTMCKKRKKKWIHKQTNQKGKDNVFPIHFFVRLNNNKYYSFCK